ncbi:hypothetical protein DC366_11565 [Pelagivirga sediminicola]|uniref:Uncharacterized protein n=1 Tax=Pelagivirga sediminicola TaxID=2170575 RepID=A0A2T7G5U8_9RHOB|nr:hypothetical protein [Pelagivirga sediminicola]PVA09756.1 hypothetical protein DC366_11565 [Pelagivirga sediminicola]
MRGSGCDAVIVKIVALFLAGMAVLAMFGRLRFPGQKRLAAAKCPKCGKFKIGKGPCSCQKGLGK